MSPLSEPSAPEVRSPRATPAPSPFSVAAFDDATGLKNMRQLIELRWIAVVGQVVTIAIVHYGLGIRLPLVHMSAVLAVLAVFNVASLLYWRNRHVANKALFVALMVDVATLTAQLSLSGGASNPFVFLYLLQVILGAVLLKAWSTWTIVVATTLSYAGLTIWYRPLELPLDPQSGLASPYVQGLLICFALNAALLVTFIGRIGRNLRARDAHLADLRQRAAEEEHIVRMGLLASGAAHELGTPLSTLSVILGDWSRMAPFAAEPELRDEIEEMQVQVKRCKAIVSGILLSAGEARGEAAVETTLRTFLDDLVAQWQATRPVRSFSYKNFFQDDLPIVSDTALKQMICNVLDNALEASPGWIGLEAVHEAGHLRLTVTDAGPGFAPEMLARFGKPYQSSKGQPGRGLGLFLVVNVARTLGGTVTADNLPEGGAAVTLMLPLDAIAMDDEDDDDGTGR